MTTLLQVELGVLGPLRVRQFGLPVAIPGAKPRVILTMLGLHAGTVVPAATLVELLWGDDSPRTAAKALQTHISALRRALGDGFVLTQGAGWTVCADDVDAIRYTTAARLGRDEMAAGEASRAVTHFDAAVKLWRGVPELPEGRRGQAERTRWIEEHAALVEDRADALLATGRAAELIGELEAAIADAPLRERRWGHLMLALYRAGRQGEALAAYQRVRALLADELGVDPGPDLRRLEVAIVAQDVALELPAAQHVSSIMRAVTFLLTDIEGSTAAWEHDADAMAAALARHDEIVERVVTFRGGRLIKTRGEGDATFSVFDRPSGAAAAAIELQQAIGTEPWALGDPLRIRIALHTGEVEFRDGDYFGRAVNRAARLRSVAAGGQIVCSGATAELVIDTLADDVVLGDLGMRQLKNLARPEHVFELRLSGADDSDVRSVDEPIERPDLPAVLMGPGPFVGRGRELERLLLAWQATLSTGTRALLIAGEPGVGKTRLAGEWSSRAHDDGAVVLYGRCDEDLGAPYQPFAEAMRTLVPCLGTSRLRELRGAESLLSLVPALTDVLPDLNAAPRADADTERYALFDAVVGLLRIAAGSAPVVLVLDDLHWAAKPTLLLLRHLLRFGEQSRVQIVGTYRSTDLDRSHPLAAMLADLNRDGSADRLTLAGLDEHDVTAYVAEAGYDDEQLARALASVTGGNPFFLIEALRHVDESGGQWDSSTLPQGVREAVSRRLSRLPAEANKALAAAAVVGSRFAVELVERVVDGDLVDAFDKAAKAGIVVEEPGGRYRFNHALVRQSLLAELPSVRRMRLHQKIAAAMESEPDADDLLADLAYHYFECAWAGNAGKAVEYCRRAADQAMARLGYEGAADLYDKALHALEELDDELPDRDDVRAELLVARCEALLAAGDVVPADGAVAQLRSTAAGSARLAAWGTCFDGQLAMLTDPERLDEIEVAVGAAAATLAGLDDAAGEAKAHTVRAGCLARLGRVGDCETALDQALTAARRAREHRLVNSVLAGAPLAALWGPNPVPRAGGRCLDVVRLLRITTGSPVVEATSTRCQGVLDAFRGRAAAGRQLIDSARRTLADLGMRHAVLEVEQFAGIVELVANDPVAAEVHLRKACNGFRRMGLDADTAETAALLARACLELGRDAEADELCSESERLGGHAFKAAIAWRSVRAQLLARAGSHDEARRMAEEAVAIAARTDALVDHGDACLALAVVLDCAGDAAGASAAAERAAELYEMKGAAALVEKANELAAAGMLSAVSEAVVAPVVVSDRLLMDSESLLSAVNRGAWDEAEQYLAPRVMVESRRKIVGFERMTFTPTQWCRELKRYLDVGMVHLRHAFLAVRGERLVLGSVEFCTGEAESDAPKDMALELVGFDEHGRMALQILFDVEDRDRAMAELGRLHTQFEAADGRGALQNAASRTDGRCNDLFAERRWEEAADLWADDMTIEDRRRGLRRKIDYERAAVISELRSLMDIGVRTMTSEVVAVRGDRLALCRTRYSGRDDRPDAFRTDILRIAEVDADGKCVASIAFDLDDLVSAIDELDARYLAGEAASHARTWSLVTAGYAALNRREIPAISADMVSIDHRRGAAFAPGELPSYIRAAWELEPDVASRIEAVHQLNDHGAVITQTSTSTTTGGFAAEWRFIHLMMLDNGLFHVAEVFDVADLDRALARFDELSRSATRLGNAASGVYRQFLSSFAIRDWRTMSDLVNTEICLDDRRRIVNGGLRIGRDAYLEELRSLADFGLRDLRSDLIATRGERLALHRSKANLNDANWEGFSAEILDLVEIDGDERVVARVVFDDEDIDEAFTELDARYLAGDAEPHVHTWSVIAGTFAAFNRREAPATTPDWVNIDHRSVVATQEGGIPASLPHFWELTQDITMYVETVHMLADRGAVMTWAATGTSQQGFDAEWRDVCLSTVVGDRVDRCELFNLDDVDAALARFDELTRPRSRLENAASRAVVRFAACFAARDWDAISDMVSPDNRSDDRRPVVGAGVALGRDAALADLRSVAAQFVDMKMESVVLALRGERLALCCGYFAGRGEWSDGSQWEFLEIIEADDDQRISASVTFEPNDLDSAFAELDARYVAGEAAACGRIWSLVVQTYAAFNRHELSTTTPDWVNIDHRLGVGCAPGDMNTHVSEMWAVVPDVSTRIEAVHRLSNLGAVFTHTESGSSKAGFDAEWREVTLLTFEGDAISRCELFDEDDLGTAIAQFDQLDALTVGPTNAATRVSSMVAGAFNCRDVAAYLGTCAPNARYDDRRRGFRSEGPIDATFGRALLFEAAESWRVHDESVATRGDHLALMRYCFRDIAESGDPVVIDAWGLLQVDDEPLLSHFLLFDVDDIDTAIAELDTRYLANEAAPYQRTWSAIVANFAAFNRRQFPSTTSDWVTIDHRRIASVEPDDLPEYIRSVWDDFGEFKTFIETVHRLGESGAVVTQVSRATSPQGFDAEWRELNVTVISGELITRAELFDEEDLEAALTRFDELSCATPLLENAASQVYGQVNAYLTARDIDGAAAALADNIIHEDRRRVVNMGTRRGRDAVLDDMRAVADLGVNNVERSVVATRGDRLALIRARVSGDERFASYEVEVLNLVEIDSHRMISASVGFDPEDLDAAFVELDARYLVGEAAPHAHTWSVLLQSTAAFNRGESPMTTSDAVNLDNRHGTTFAPGDFFMFANATDVVPDMHRHVEAVHRLTDHGAVVTGVAHGISRTGFDAEWRAVVVATIDGELISRYELFDEDDLDAALARFDELTLKCERHDENRANPS